jgi:hypothetical protein
MCLATTWLYCHQRIFSPAAEQAENHANVKNERFHRQLKVILKSFFKAQEPNALHNIPLQLGQACQRVNLYVPLQFFIGDVEGGDQLASRQTFKGEICCRLCCTCVMFLLPTAHARIYNVNVFVCG